MICNVCGDIFTKISGSVINEEIGEFIHNNVEGTLEMYLVGRDVVMAEVERVKTERLSKHDDIGEH